MYNIYIGCNMYKIIILKWFMLDYIYFVIYIINKDG